MCDTLLEVLRDIIIGVISGALSSWAVTALWQKKMNKLEKKRQAEVDKRTYESTYFDTVQVFCRYLDRLQLELDIDDKGDKAENIRRLIDSQPMTTVFTDALNSDGVNLLTEFHQVKNEIVSSAQDGTLSKEKSELFRRDLFRIECQFLKNQRAYLKLFSQSDNDQIC